MSIRPGDKFKDRYIILNEVGEGAFASVYQAQDQELGRVVAIKLLRVNAGEFAADLERFQREARLMAQIKHPNIVSVYSFDFLANAQPCIIMEYLEGETLTSFLANHGKLDEECDSNVLLQIAQGLAYAHKMDLVHRDLSPNNIFLVGDKKNPTVKLIDFGLSRPLSDSATKLTQTGFIIGTPQYMSPEAARGQIPDIRSDIYSFGCVMYEALSGKIPLNSETPIGYLRLQQYSYPAEPDISRNDRKKEKLLKHIMLRCMQKEPELRFQSCNEIVQALSVEPSSQASTDVVSRQNAIHPWSDAFVKQQRRTLRLRVLLAGSALLLCTSLFCFQDKLLQITAQFFVNSRSSLFEHEEVAFAADLKNKGRFLPAAMLYGDLYKRSQRRQQQDKEVSFGLSEAECYFSQEKYSTACNVLIDLLLQSQKFSIPAERENALVKIFELIDQYVRSGLVSRTELELRARLLLLMSDSNVRQKGDFMKRSEQKLLGRVVQYSDNVSYEEAAKWQTLDDDQLKKLILPAVLSVIKDPKFVMNDEQQSLLGRSFLAHSVDVQKAELASETMSDEQKHLGRRLYLLSSCGNDLERLRAGLVKLIADCRNETDVKAEWPAIYQLASVDASLKHFDLALKEAAQAQALERLVEEVIVGKADLLELRIYIEKGDPVKAKDCVNKIMDRLAKMKPLYNPDLAAEIIQTGRGRSRFNTKITQAAYRRAFEALAMVNEPKLALQIWSELVAFDEKYKVENVSPMDRAQDFQPLLDLAKSGKIKDAQTVKSINDISLSFAEHRNDKPGLDSPGR